MSRSIVRTPRFFLALPAATLFALTVACGAGSAAPAERIDTNPTTTDGAKAAAEQIRARLDANPNDAEALAAREDLHAHLDALNHLVARVEAAPGHVVSFYDTGDGSIVIEEKQPKGEPSAVGEEASLLSPTALFAKLAHGAEPPAALAHAESRVAPATSDALTPGLVSAPPESTRPAGVRPDTCTPTTCDIQSNPFQCFTGGDFHSCQPNWGNGGSYTFNTKRSWFRIRPYSGNTFYISFSYNNGAGGFFQPIYVNDNDYNYWAASGVRTQTWCTPFCWSSTDYVIGTHVWTLVQAGGVGFDWSTESRWSCTYHQCDTP